MTKITIDTIIARGACRDNTGWERAFTELYPDGLDPRNWTLKEQLRVLRSEGRRWLGWCWIYGVVSRWSMRNSDLCGSDLRNSDLRGSDLSDADLSYASLRGSDLSGAYLSYADLSNSELSYANLRGSNLSGAYLPDGDIAGWIADEHGRLKREAE